MFGKVSTKTRRRPNFPSKSAEKWVGWWSFLKDLCKEDLVFPPWSDHPLACTTLKEVRTQGSESYEKEENFPKNTQDVLLEVSFCSFGFGRLLGSFCVNPRRRRRRGRRSVWRKLKICKFSLVFGKICFFLESLSSVLLFLAGFWRCRPWGFEESCQYISSEGEKQYVFGFKISQILWAVSWSSFEQWRLILEFLVNVIGFFLIAWFWIFLVFFLLMVKKINLK